MIALSSFLLSQDTKIKSTAIYVFFTLLDKIHSAMKSKTILILLEISFISIINCACELENNEQFNRMMLIWIRLNQVAESKNISSKNIKSMIMKILNFSASDKKIDIHSIMLIEAMLLENKICKRVPYTIDLEPAKVNNFKFKLLICEIISKYFAYLKPFQMLLTKLSPFLYAKNNTKVYSI